MIFWQEPVPTNGQATASHAIATSLPIPVLNIAHKDLELIQRQCVCVCVCVFSTPGLSLLRTPA